MDRRDRSRRADCPPNDGDAITIAERDGWASVELSTVVTRADDENLVARGGERELGALARLIQDPDARTAMLIKDLKTHEFGVLVRSDTDHSANLVSLVQHLETVGLYDPCALILHRVLL